MSADHMGIYRHVVLFARFYTRPLCWLATSCASLFKICRKLEFIVFHPPLAASHTVSSQSRTFPPCTPSIEWQCCPSLRTHETWLVDCRLLNQIFPPSDLICRAVKFSSASWPDCPFCMTTVDFSQTLTLSANRSKWTNTCSINLPAKTVSSSWSTRASLLSATTGQLSNAELVSQGNVSDQVRF